MMRCLHAFAGALVLFAPAGLAAQSAQEVMEDARAHQEARMEGIDDYRVTHTVMGHTSTMYFVREDVDGRSVFVPVLPELPAGATSNAERPAPAEQMDTHYFLRPEVVERMTLEGAETIDGEACWVIALEDLDGLDVGVVSGGEQEFRTESVRMYMDRDEYVPRRMVMTGTMSVAGEVHPMTTSISMRDYREVEGMLYPFLTEITNEGLGAMAGSMPAGGQEDLAEMMAEMEDQLESLPEAQRAMVEQMMKDQGGAGQPMANGASNTIVVETVEVVVNAGPPGGA